MTSPRQLTDALRYLADLGWEDLYRRPQALAPAPSTAVPPAAALASPGATDVLAGRTLPEVASEASECRRCRLCETRQRVVFGDGDARARLMFVGEAPGAEEDRQGLPFVGPAGTLLTRIIGAIDLTRAETYIANVVKCRPPGNREPQPDEVEACRGYLEAQIDAVRPAVLVCLGRVAAQSLLGTDAPVGRLRGQWFEVRGVPTLVTYHPAALLRNAALKRPTWEDMQRVRDRLRDPSSAVE